MDTHYRVPSYSNRRTLGPADAPHAALRPHCGERLDPQRHCAELDAPFDAWPAAERARVSGVSAWRLPALPGGLVEVVGSCDLDAAVRRFVLGRIADIDWARSEVAWDSSAGPHAFVFVGAPPTEAGAACAVLLYLVLVDDDGGRAHLGALSAMNRELRRLMFDRPWGGGPPAPARIERARALSVHDHRFAFAVGDATLLNARCIIGRDMPFVSD
ncbi:Hypothetical protein A7982_07273 [Minicystis rosea]|nr:Hypothetical protein A7982_07273 [Minicystis rosea]